MVSSSSAWTVILFLLFSIWGAKQEPVAVLNAISCISGAIIYYRLARELITDIKNTQFLYIIPAVYICILLPVSLGLMESSISMALCGLALLLLVKKNRISLILFGSLPFFRYELVILTGLFVMYVLIKKTFAFRTVIVSIFLGSFPFLLYEYVFFKTFVPNSIIAKSSGYYIGFIPTFLSIVRSMYPTLDPYPLFSLYSNLGFQLVLFSMVLTLIILTIHHRKVSFFDFRTLLLTTGLLVCVFYFIGKSIIFPRYSPLYLIPFFMGIMFLFIKENLVVVSILFLFVLPSAVCTTYTIYGIITEQKQYIQFFDQNARVVKYTSLGKELYDTYPNSVLATSEIGGLGWGFEGYIADGFGLASPAAIKYQNKLNNGGTGVISSEYIEQIQPELIVSMDIFDRSLRENGNLTNYHYFSEPIYLPEDEQCLQVKNLWGATKIDVFIRTDLIKGSQ